MNIEIWSIGKQSESYINEGIQNYFKKIKPYCSISLEIFQPRKNAPSPQQQKLLEEEMILRRIQPEHTLILLDEKGENLSSPQIAELLQNRMNMSTRTLVFLIGGAFGVSERVFRRADMTWSLSQSVFPHQLVRLILAEQIYRGFSILNHLPYHHS